MKYQSIVAGFESKHIDLSPFAHSWESLNVDRLTYNIVDNNNTSIFIAQATLEGYDSVFNLLSAIYKLRLLRFERPAESDEQLKEIFAGDLLESSSKLARFEPEKFYALLIESVGMKHWKQLEKNVIDKEEICFALHQPGFTGSHGYPHYAYTEKELLYVDRMSVT